MGVTSCGSRRWRRWRRREGGGGGDLGLGRAPMDGGPDTMEAGGDVGLGRAPIEGGRDDQGGVAGRLRHVVDVAAGVIGVAARALPVKVSKACRTADPMAAAAARKVAAAAAAAVDPKAAAARPAGTAAAAATAAVDDRSESSRRPERLRRLSMASAYVLKIGVPAPFRSEGRRPLSARGLLLLALASVRRSATGPAGRARRGLCSASEAAEQGLETESWTLGRGRGAARA